MAIGILELFAWKDDWLILEDGEKKIALNPVSNYSMILSSNCLDQHQINMAEDFIGINITSNYCQIWLPN